MKRIITLAAVALCSIAAVGCESSSETTSASSYRSTSDVDTMSFRERRQMLSSYRSNTERCISPSVDCKVWTGLALKCEINMAEIDKGNYASLPYRGACTDAEEWRERVTGIESSNAPKAYVF